MNSCYPPHESDSVILATGGEYKFLLGLTIERLNHIKIQSLVTAKLKWFHIAPAIAVLEHFTENMLCLEIAKKETCMLYNKVGLDVNCIEKPRRCSVNGAHDIQSSNPCNSVLTTRRSENKSFRCVIL